MKYIRAPPIGSLSVAAYVGIISSALFSMQWWGRRQSRFLAHDSVDAMLGSGAVCYSSSDELDEYRVSESDDGGILREEHDRNLYLICARRREFGALAPEGE